VRVREGVLPSLPRAMTGFLLPLLWLTIAKKKLYPLKDSKHTKEEGKRESQK
jgi:hypothetical protein